MFFDLQDPETGKKFRFQGIIDRLMVDDDTVWIRDWKTHFVPPSEEEIRAEDFQLGLYVIGLRQLFPELMKGKKVKVLTKITGNKVLDIIGGSVSPARLKCAFLPLEVIRKIKEN